MTPPPDDDPPQPPKRRRKPPRGLEGFETGYPEEDETPETAAPVPRRPIWSEPSSPTSSPTDPTAVAPAPTATTSDGIPPLASGVVESPSTVSSGWSQPGAAPSVEPVAGDEAPASTRAPAMPDDAMASSAMPSGAMASAAVLDRDEPLSAAYVGAPDTALREAVGAKPKKAKPKRARTPPPDVDTFDEDFGGDGKPRSRKMIAVAILSLVVGLGVAALIFLGRSNSAWFYISCEPDRIVAERGRAFPPWGESTLDGKQWTAIKIPPEAECLPLETESEEELADQFRTMLVKRASVLLTAKEVTKTDEASALLEQALLHARSNTDSARNARTDIQRLLGDVAYWRASLKLRDASKALLDAAKQFDAAAQQRPRHVTDAAAWADYVRKLVGELEAGPSGTTQTTFPPAPPAPSSEPRPPAPPGVALPVEPDRGSASESPAPPDAGIPTGGVLL